jgi:hypothetical protein
MIFGTSHPRVEVLAPVPAGGLPWCHEGALVFVSKGLGALRWQVVKAEGVTKLALMLRDTPLLFAGADESWCPTCEKLLALGWGRDRVDDETLAVVRAASDDVEAPVGPLVNRIQSVLQLLPERAVRALEKRCRTLAADRAAAVERAPSTATLEDSTNCDWAAMATAARRFPTSEGLAACSLAGDTSEQRIDELFAAGESSGPRLWAILQALIVSRNPPATTLALRIGEGHRPDLWRDAFRHLSTVPTERVEDFFIQFLIRDEGLRPWLVDIANDYLAQATTGDE